MPRAQSPPPTMSTRLLRNMLHMAHRVEHPRCPRRPRYSSIGGFLGWKEPPPAAMISALAGMNVVPFFGRLDPKQRRFRRSDGLDAFHHLVEVEGRMERVDLRHQVVDEPLARHHGKARDVVDGLLRIELGALAGRPSAGCRSRWHLMSRSPSSKTAKRPTGPAPITTTSVSILSVMNRLLRGAFQKPRSPGFGNAAGAKPSRRRVRA